MRCEPTKASCPIRTRRPDFSSINDTEARKSTSPGQRCFRQRQMRDIDAVDDVEMPRQQPLEQFDRPGLERFRQQRVVGVGQRRDRDLPGFIPAEIVQVDQDAHQFGDGETRMGVVELHRGLGRQTAQLAVGGKMAVDQILQRRRDEEIFLA